MKISNRNKGLTLIEIVVALGVFGIVVSVVANIFAYEFKGQRKNLAMQTVQDNSRYTLELMSKEIRMSHVEVDSSSNILHCRAYKPGGMTEDVRYTLSNGRILRNGMPITSSEVNVSRLKFYINDKNDPPARVTIAIGINSIGTEAEQQAEVNMHTTISTRDY